MNNPSEREQDVIELSHDVALLYVLRPSKCIGRLTAGLVSFQDSTLSVFDVHGEAIEYVSAANLTSWCLLGAHAPLLMTSWYHIAPDDLPIIMTSRFATALKETLASALSFEIPAPQTEHISGERPSLLS